MNENEMTVEEGFYHAVAGALECDGHSYRKFPYSKKTRWNNRLPGNGRFPGHGLVRFYSPTNIHVNLYNPKISGHYISIKDAMTAIEDMLVESIV